MVNKQEEKSFENSARLADYLVELWVRLSESVSLYPHLSPLPPLPPPPEVALCGLGAGR